MTILPESIDLASLPWLPLDEKSAFPKRSAIYFAIDGSNVVQYIGRTVDARQRWSGHHRYEELSKMEQVRVAYLFVDDITSLPLIETIFIQHYKPQLNRFPGSSADVGIKELEVVPNVVSDNSKASYSEILLSVLANENSEAFLDLIQNIPRFVFVNAFENKVAGPSYKKDDPAVQSAISSVRKMLFESPLEYLVRIRDYRFMLLFGLSDYCKTNPDFFSEYLKRSGS